MTDVSTPHPWEALRALSTGTIAGLLIKLAGLRTRVIQGVRPLDMEHCRFVGPAFTIRNVPLREDRADRASMVSPRSPLFGTYDTIPAGSVVVFDMRGDATCGAIGDLIAARLQQCGIAALVADGAMRDADAIAQSGLPVFCGGSAPAPSNRALLAADVQVVIGCGEVMVEPGDIVVGDPDGVVVVPSDLVAAVAREGAALERAEAWARQRILEGARLADVYPIGEAPRRAPGQD